MEKKLHALLVARRKRSRRCSARWLSHTPRALMRDEFASLPGAADFKACPR
jgi:kynureninase